LGSPVKEPPPPGSLHGDATERDAPFLEPSFIPLSKSPVYESPSRFPSTGWNNIVIRKVRMDMSHFPLMLLSVACSFTLPSVHILQNKKGFITGNVSACSCPVSLDAIGGVYTGCTRRNVPDFGRMFLMLNYTDITQNTYIQS
jgi:hypothetical protein